MVHSLCSESSVLITVFKDQGVRNAQLQTQVQLALTAAVDASQLNFNDTSLERFGWLCKLIAISKLLFILFRWMSGGEFHNPIQSSSSRFRNCVRVARDRYWPNSHYQLSVC